MNLSTVFLSLDFSITHETLHGYEKYMCAVAGTERAGLAGQAG
jgi:hypothetical protein